MTARPIKPDEVMGVPASPSGCQPTASAADASSLSGIPNAGFTPGPWASRVSNGVWVVARDRGDVLVCEAGLAGPGYLTPEADARLIAAAPELYEALEGMLARPGLKARIAAMKALAKARGDAQ